MAVSTSRRQKRRQLEEKKAAEEKLAAEKVFSSSSSVTTEELFEKFMQLDVDASGRVSKRELARFLAGDDLKHSFIVEFPTADTGISWGDGPDGRVVVSAIEPGSPAAEHPDVSVGLALATANGQDPAPGGAKAVRRLWQQFHVHEPTTLEFYEPWLITHDFANLLDVEIEPQAGDDETDSAYSRKHALFSHFHRTSQKRPLLFLGGGRSSGTSSAATISTGAVVATARLASRAYAEPIDVELAIGEALFEAAPVYFNPETAVSIDAKEQTLTIATKNCANIRVMATAGPSRFASVHRHLGFPNEPQAAKPTQTSASRRLACLRLGFRESAHVRTFTDELLIEFDSNQNNWLEFDEFRLLYKTHLHSAAAVEALRERVKVRFRSDEELRLLAEQEEHRRRRETFRKNLEERRDRNRKIRDQQKQRMEAEMYRDCDHQMRRRHYDRVAAQLGILNEGDGDDVAERRRDDRADASVVVVEEQRHHEDDRPLTRKQRRNLERRLQLTRRDARLQREAEAETRARRRAAEVAERRRRQHANHLTDLGFLNVFSRDGAAASVSGQRERHDQYHPALAGHAFRPRAFDATHPAFCGLARVTIKAHKPVSNEFRLYVAQTLLLQQPCCCKNRWRAFYAPPLNRGLARHRYRELATAHDRSEIIHPAFWGSAVAPRSILQDPTVVSPVVLGYALECQTASDPTFRHGIPYKAPPVRRLPAGGGAKDALLGVAGGFDEDAEACHICLGGRLGCPFCFEFPEGFEPKDFEYLPDDEEKNRTRRPKFDDKKLPALHTDLTTRTAIVYHRCRRTNAADVLIKTMPCGEIVRVRVETTDTVDHLHHLFRSNSPFGINQTAVMYLPTETGLIAFDVGDSKLKHADDGTKIPSPGTVPVFRYGLNRERAHAVLFHGLHESITDVIQVFINSNLLLEKFPDATRVITHLNDKPRTLPGSDVLQAKLWDLFELQEAQHRNYKIVDEKSRVQAEKDDARRRLREYLDGQLQARRRERALTPEGHLDVQGCRRPRADKRKLHDLLASLSTTSLPKAAPTCKPLVLPA